MPNERLTLEIAAKAIGQESIDSLSSALNRFSAAAEASGTKANKAFKQVQESADNSTGSLRRLFLAVKDFGEGRNAFATVEAGYFAMSLGTVGIAAGIAAGAIIGVVAAQRKAAEASEKMRAGFADLNLSLRTTNDSLLVANDRLANEIAKLEGKPQNALKLALDETRLANDKLAESLDATIGKMQKVFSENSRGFFSGLIHGEAPSDSIAKELGGLSGFGGFRGRLADAKGDPKKAASMLDAEIAKLQAMGVEETIRQQTGQNTLSHSRNKEFIDQAVRDLSSQRENIDLTTQNSGLEGDLAKAKAKKDFSDSQKAERSKEQEMLKGGMEETLGQLKRDHDLTMGEESAFWTKRLAEVDKFGGRYLTLHKDIIDKLGALAQERDRTNKRISTELQGMTVEGWDRIAKEQDSQARRDDESVVGSANRGSQTEDLRSRSTLDARLSGLDQQRRAAQRAGSLTPIGSSQGQLLASRIAESAKLADLDQQEGQLRLNEEAKLLEQIDAMDTEKREAQSVKIVELARQTNAKVYDDNTRTLDLIHDEQLRQLDSFKSAVGGAFDALMNHSFGGFLKSQGLNIGKTIAENAATQFLYPAIKNAIPHAGDATSGLGKLLSGTPFAADPLKLATDANTAATIQNTAALARSITGGGGGLPGGSFGGGVSSGNPMVFNAAGGGIAGDMGDGLPMDSTGLNHGVPKVNFGGSSLGKNLGLGAAAAGGAFSAFSDFRSGGAKNDIAGVGAGLGSAAAIAAMIPGGQVVALGLGIASAATSLIAAVMPDPKKVREAGIQKALAQNQYLAPTALNVSQDTSGNYTDFDARGNVRTSSFSSTPTVTQPYTWWKGNTPYSVPGQVTSPFSQRSGAAQPPVVIIQAADAQSFNDMAQRNRAGLSDAVASHLQSGDGRLHNMIRSVAGA